MTTEITKHEPIPEKTIKKLLDEAKNLEFWAKLEPQGFLVDEHLLPEIIGYIIIIRFYWVKWDNRQPDKVYEEEPPSDDYELRCEIKIETLDGFIVNIDLSKSNYCKLAAFTKSVQNAGSRLEKIPVRLRTREVTGSFGPYVVIDFIWINKDLNISDNDDIPF